MLKLENSTADNCRPDARYPQTLVRGRPRLTRSATPAPGGRRRRTTPSVSTSSATCPRTRSRPAVPCPPTISIYIIRFTEYYQLVKQEDHRQFKRLLVNNLISDPPFIIGYFLSQVWSRVIFKQYLSRTSF